MTTADFAKAVQTLEDAASALADACHGGTERAFVCATERRDAARAAVLAAYAATQDRADSLAPGSAFAGWVLSELREEYLGCDLDGGDAQDAAVRYGLMEAVPVNARCGDDCRCADDDNIPGDCYRYTHAGKTAVVAHAFYPTPAPGAGGHDG